MTDTPLKILKATRELLDDPIHWTQGQLAIDEYGHFVLMTSPRARSFCLAGALSKSGTDWVAYEGAKKLIYEHLEVPYISEGGVIPEFNDKSTHDEVLELLDSVIAKAEGVV